MSVTPFPVPPNESARLRLLESYRIAGTPRDAEYGRFAELATAFFKTPVAGISFVGAERVWFTSPTGLDISEIDRGDAFCSHTIMQGGIFVIPDTKADRRFCENPIVVGPPRVRFYAGAPLIAPGGEAVGAIWVLDVVPRPGLDPEERRVLADLAAMVVDHLEKHRLITTEREANERFLKIAETTPDAIVCAEESGDVIFWNDAAERIFGHRRDAIVGRHAAMLLPERERSGFARWLDVMRRNPGRGGKLELACRRADGSEFPAEGSYSSWIEQERVVLCGMIRDVSARHQADEALRLLAQTDSLTGLANRAMFLERLNALIRPARSRRSAQPACTLLLIDLDRFKEVNDALGHGAGDRVLQQLARRLARFASDDVLPARLSGDEFTMILAGGSGAAAAMALAERVRAELTRPVRIRGQQLDVGASIGIATFPDHASNPNDLLANADLALYRAKAEGGDRSILFASAFRDAASGRRQIEGELRRAEREREFVLYYQPQVSIVDGTILGAEALLRWQHPRQGLLLPSSFMPVLETAPVANAVGAWVIETAVAAVAEWIAATARPLRVGVNLFPSQFLDGELIALVKASLERHKLPPSALEIEVTENVALRHDAGVATPLKRLFDAGVSVAFDDFGTGYGSLSHLKRVPVTRLKIDRSFVHGILSDPGDTAIVRAVVALGGSLGLGVTAEGVETEAQRRCLEALGCREAQGHLFGAPMTARDFAALLASNQSSVTSDQTLPLASGY